MEPMDESENVEKVTAAPFKKPILVGKVGRFPKKFNNKIENKPDSESGSQDQELAQPQAPLKPPEKVPDKKLSETAIPEKSPTLPLPYKEPAWSGLPKSSGLDYNFEVLKNGAIIENFDLMSKPFWVFGRLPNCDISLQHPTISRYHAILQYRAEKTDEEDTGFYIYDLGSTHGTFLNKNRLKSRVYAPVKVGHMLKLGCSTRNFILNGPEEDAEQESEFTVTELKQRRQEELRKREELEREAELERERLEEERKKKEEERGIDWGLGEDAEEETDLTENPFAQHNHDNEELYLDDPKKALRGFFEREGLDLEYDCTEQNMGQFLCKIELPLDDETGRPVYAEVVHKGKKKEAVVQCALEACRILDRHGVLRQAKHESRKRKPKNWEENDYYDSDEDTFLDRTGTVEKKREMRMKAKVPQKAETYESLMEREQTLTRTISKLERDLREAQSKLDLSEKSHQSAGSNTAVAAPDDTLDSYMKELKQSKPDKQTINKLKLDLTRSRQEHANCVRLINIARPASLPPLRVISSGDHTESFKSADSTKVEVDKDNLTDDRTKNFDKDKNDVVLLLSKPSTSGSCSVANVSAGNSTRNLPGIGNNSRIMPIFGKRKRLKLAPSSEPGGAAAAAAAGTSKGCQTPSSSSTTTTTTTTRSRSNDDDEHGNVEKMDADSNEEEFEEESEKEEEKEKEKEDEDSDEKSEEDDEQEKTNEDGDSEKKDGMTLEDFEELLHKQKLIPPLTDEHEEKITRMLHKLKKLANTGDRLDANWKMLEAKKRKVLKLIADVKNSGNSPKTDQKLQFRIISEFNRILREFNEMNEQKVKVIGKVKEMGTELKTICEEIDVEIEQLQNRDDLLKRRLDSAKDGGNSESSQEEDSESEEKDIAPKKNDESTAQSQNSSGRMSGDVTVPELRQHETSDSKNNEIALNESGKSTAQTQNSSGKWRDSSVVPESNKKEDLDREKNDIAPRSKDESMAHTENLSEKMSSDVLVPELRQHETSNSENTEIALEESGQSTAQTQNSSGKWRDSSVVPESNKKEDLDREKNDIAPRNKDKSMAQTQNFSEKRSSDVTVPELDEDDENNAEDKKRRKNQRKIQLKRNRAEMEKQRGYEEDSSRADYNMWVPPSGQSGDGRTSLNDKYGY